MMGGNNYYVRIVQLLILMQFLDSYLALPLCTDSTAPFTEKSPLQFCPYNGSRCCNSTQDLRLKKQFESMNISDSACASVLKSIICAKCDPFSSELFTVASVPRNLPLLCNSTVSPNSTQSNQQSSTNFCSQVWSTCQNISIINSPFAASLQGRVTTPTNSTATKLTDIWQSQPDFCTALGASSGDSSPCFNGSPVTLNATKTPTPPAGMCLEKIGNGSYLNMAPHPDGSNRVFLSNQPGKIFLATIPKQGSGGLLEIDEGSPFLDITDEVHFDTEFGMLGIAFHPKYTENGRFFVSFSCDKAKWPDCGGRCACNSDVNCDPSKLAPDNGANPCQFQSVIAEFQADPSATRASPSEVRRIFTMGLPFTSHHGGQILFGPGDGYLYFMMGDGGGVNDPYNFAQNKKSLLGKIMRFDIDNIPSAGEVSRLGLWGNYSIPKDNPHNTVDNELQDEIWALGMRNPWRCSFDSARPEYFACSDVGQDHYEEVDLITKNGNYGWSAYEGPYANKNASIVRPIFPVMGYNHTEVNVNVGSASITGGYFYRSMTDPCMYGKYLFADLYAGAMWAGSENPINSGKFTSSRISFNCARDSPLDCTYTESSLPALSYIFSFGEDNSKDVFLLTNSGVYRVVAPSRCNYTCAKEMPSTTVSPGPVASPPSSDASVLRSPYEVLMLLVSSLCLVFLNFV